MADRRVILLVADACGVGALPDAARYGDAGAATLPHVAEAVGGLDMPHCGRLGLGNIAPITGVPAAVSPAAAFGKMAERSGGKDSTYGHWELCGVVVETAFPVFPCGFPRAIVEAFERAAGVRTMGNVAASGSQLIDRLGARHLETGELILYTSADSVFQLAAHESVVPPQRLYDICRIARDLLRGENGVGRVIARPFAGEPGAFRRTSGRRDFSLPPPVPSLLEALQIAGFGVLAIGKVSELFAGVGIDTSIKTASNAQAMDHVLQAVSEDRRHRLVFANLCDFDELWGHRNDADGFARELAEFDRRLGELLTSLRRDDVLIVTADHGCDPTRHDSTDHTREYVPVLVYAETGLRPTDLGTRETFSDVAATLAGLFDLTRSFPGRSFLNDIAERPNA